MIIKPLFAVLAVAVLSGCASTRQVVPLPDQSKVVQDASKARVYVVRPTFAGGAVPMKVRDGDQVIGQTGGNGYLCWERVPGETTIKSKAENTALLPLKTEAGVVYYVQQNIRMGILFARNKLSLLSEPEGKAALLKCKPPQVAN